MQYQTSKTGKQAYKISRIPLGDIVIDIQKARAQALDYGSSLHDELKRLLIHGLLHLAGYDHEKSRYAAQKMRAKEHALLKDLNTF
jgi:probable rRNA maturation factor